MGARGGRGAGRSGGAGAREAGARGPRTRAGAARGAGGARGSGAGGGGRAPERPLDIGAAGPEVEGLQRWLEQRGYFRHPGGCTGYYGPVTRAAVLAWQRDIGLSASGVFGPDSLAAYRNDGGRGEQVGRGPKGVRLAGQKSQVQAPRRGITGVVPAPEVCGRLERLARGQGVAGFLFQAAAGFALVLAGSVAVRGLQLVLRGTSSHREKRRQRELRELERRALEAQRLKRRWKGSLESDRSGRGGEPPPDLDLPGFLPEDDPPGEGPAPEGGGGLGRHRDPLDTPPAPGGGGSAP